MMVCSRIRISNYSIRELFLKDALRARAEQATADAGDFAQDDKG
jgi:hypothetical protein